MWGAGGEKRKGHMEIQSVIKMCLACWRVDVKPCFRKVRIQWFMTRRIQSCVAFTAALCVGNKRISPRLQVDEILTLIWLVLSKMLPFLSCISTFSKPSF